MRYQIITTNLAAQELQSATDWLAQYSHGYAERWFQEICAAIQSLEQFPERCGLAPENSEFGYELRQFVFGRRNSYRILFTIQEPAVIILSVRHHARDAISPDELSPE